MSAVIFTDRELKRAWRELTDAWQKLSEAALTAHNDNLENARCLLLIYAVECGLKAVWLKRKSLTLFDKQAIGDIGHDLHKLLKELRSGAELSLQDSWKLSPINAGNGQTQRSGHLHQLHQVWRYGGTNLKPDAKEFEAQLNCILQWIKGELK